MAEGQRPADAASPDTGDAGTPPAPLLELREQLPPVVESADALADVCAGLASGTGPIAIDAERASGYRYSQRAYLIQVRRDGSGSALIDPIAFSSLEPLQKVLAESEWIVHAATQDLPCLAEVGLRPSRLFDTELAGRLLGFPRVGLATLVEELLGYRMRKEHSAVDWSTRPLPEPWLHYAALDVEVLPELRAVLSRRLEEAGKTEWAAQEFDHLLGFEPQTRIEGWRRTSGAHRLRGRRAMAVVKIMWETRDEIARDEDIAPGRLIPDSAIVAAAAAMPTGPAELIETPGFHGRAARRHLRRWIRAVDAARALPEDQLPVRAPRSDGPPQPRVWADKDPTAARRLAHARPAMTGLAKELEVPVENLLTPDHLRRVLWTPPETRDPAQLTESVAAQLAGYSARPWQIELAGPLLTEAILAAEAVAP